jgi:hypothetical protein
MTNRPPMNYHKSRYKDATAHTLCDLAYGWGYHGNQGISKRQQRALELCLRGCYQPVEVVLNRDGCPVVTRFTVTSASDPLTTYEVMHIPNEQAYTCTCPDTWEPSCKHIYGAQLLQEGFNLAHLHHRDMATYGTLITHIHQTHTEFRPHELAVLQVMQNVTFAYYSLVLMAIPPAAP